MGSKHRGGQGRPPLHELYEKLYRSAVLHGFYKRAVTDLTFLPYALAWSRTGKIKETKEGWNMDIFDFKLTDNEMEQLKMLDENKSMWAEYDDPMIVQYAMAEE